MLQIYVEKIVPQKLIVIVFNLDPDSYTFLVNTPSEPTVVYEISLKMSPEEYVCLMASVLSLWLGISILMLTQFISDCCFKIHNKYFNNINIFIKSKRFLNTKLNASIGLCKAK